MRKIKHGRLAGGCSDACCLKLEGLSVHIQGEDILEDVSFHLHCGEIAALIGPNGAGKSTLMKLLVAALMPTGGNILVDGTPLNKSESQLKASLGYLPQDFGLFDEASAEQAARSWIDVQHFFSAPYYVISYCVSNDAALQIYQLEQETPGAGLKAFSDLLYAAPESTFLAMLQDGSLTSPFDENRMQDLAAYFKEAL